MPRPLRFDARPLPPTSAQHFFDAKGNTTPASLLRVLYDRVASMPPVWRALAASP